MDSQVDFMIKDMVKNSAEGRGFLDDLEESLSSSRFSSKGRRECQISMLADARQRNRNIDTMSGRLRNYLTLKEADYLSGDMAQIVDTATDAIAIASSANLRIVAVLAPMFTESNIRDGYNRRVKAIDDLMPADFFRVYLSPEDSGRSMFKRWDERHIEIVFDPSDDDMTSKLLSLQGKFGMVYCQSAYKAVPSIVQATSGTFIYDLHGSVPEELEMMGKREPSAHYGAWEHDAAMRADVLVSVTDAMWRHYRDKYPDFHAEAITLPIFDVTGGREDAAHIFPEDIRPTVVYAGGLQRWQQVGKMLDVLEESRADCSYEFFVPDPQGLRDICAERGIDPSGLLIESRSPAELQVEYEHCQFGFLLREDNVVNNVACPTKCIEYLKNGVVPILDSEHVGDFVEMGMSYVALKDYLEGRIPDRDAWLSMVQTNYCVYDRLNQRFQMGARRLREIFDAV